MTLTPAYGRDYKTAKAAKDAWADGVDFIIADMSSPWNGKPTSIRDGHAGYINLRFDSLRKLADATKVKPVG